MDQRLRRVFSELFKVAPGAWSDALSPEQVEGWNSLGHLSLINALEEEFEVAFADGDLTEMDSVGAIKALLARRGVAA
jgi:acyl carrier protein